MDLGLFKQLLDLGLFKTKGVKYLSGNLRPVEVEIPYSKEIRAKNVCPTWTTNGKKRFFSRFSLWWLVSLKSYNNLFVAPLLVAIA